MPSIALDARLTKQMSVGMQAYVREMATRVPACLPNARFIVFGNRRFEVSANALWVQLDDPVAANGGLGEQLVYPKIVARHRPELIHYMSVYAPRRKVAPSLYTIHDLIHLRYPDYFSWKVPPYYRLVVGPVARSSRFVITDANATIADLHSFLQVDHHRVRVIPLGVRREFLVDESQRAQRAHRASTRFALTLPYFIYAGNHRPHKNLATLVAAWSRMKAATDLVITEDGPLPEGWDRDEKSNGRIVPVGHVTQDELVDLYTGCIAAIQPSLYEGFGLGALEAMAAGAPLIVARTPALLELVAETAWTFPPLDFHALATIMERASLHPGAMEAHRTAARARAASFTWDNTARQTAALYQEALEC